ncbi:hypothetical protein AVEN_108007-1 [Araneus ventricosus]|uniref:Uncharacterized protein n=1 Tax=Araneus ventricosus TaxID=182803 RepID=A0A4Y2DTV7_ARAVE|nr:hypothetical protein AVEN_108007-1 [Araneus ventricosus]
MLKSRLLVEEKRISRTESEDVIQEERALHTKNYLTHRSAAEKPAKTWTRKQDEEADRRSTKCFSCKERRQNQSEQEKAVLHIEDKKIEIRITSPPESEVNTDSIQTTNNTTEVQNQMLECADQHQRVCLNYSYEEPSNDNEDENTIGTVEKMKKPEACMHYNINTDYEDNALLPCRGQSSRNRTRKVPNYLNDFVLYSAKETGCAPEVEECKTPTTVKEALASNESKIY